MDTAELLEQIHQIIEHCIDMEMDLDSILLDQGSYNRFSAYIGQEQKDGFNYLGYQVKPINISYEFIDVVLKEGISA